MKKTLSDKWFWFTYSARHWFRRTRPFKWLIDGNHWIRYRTTDKYNVIQISSLEPGYYDSDRRLIHGMFDLLVEFVEQELAHFTFACNYAEYKKQIPWWKSEKEWVKENFLMLVNHHWDWAMKLTMDCDDQGNPRGNDLEVNHEGTQGYCSKELKEIYYWYKNEYLDPKWDNLKYEKGQDFMKVDEEQYQKETEMLCRLIKVRGRMWT